MKSRYFRALMYPPSLASLKPFASVLSASDSFSCCAWRVSIFPIPQSFIDCFPIENANRAGREDLPETPLLIVMGVAKIDLVKLSATPMVDGCPGWLVCNHSPAFRLWDITFHRGKGTDRTWQRRGARLRFR